MSDGTQKPLDGLDGDLPDCVFVEAAEEAFLALDEKEKIRERNDQH